MGVEVKADKTKKPTMLQVKCGQEIQNAGGWWMVVYDEPTLALMEQIIKEKLYR